MKSIAFSTAGRCIFCSGLVFIATLANPVHADNSAMTSVVQQHDGRLASVLAQQVTDLQSPWLGAVTDGGTGLHHVGTVSGLLKSAAAAYLHSESAYYRDTGLLERMKLAAAFLNRSQTEDGNVDLLTTNFNSPPDTGFVVQNVATAARIAQLHDGPAVLVFLKPFLLRAGDGLARGGIHTPNHRWVVCAALAQINELFPSDHYVERIDAWLAEGIDIDKHGQYNERSTTIYNAVTNTALVIMARKLDRPELLDPVRRNLEAMAYLLHANGEVVTEISRRQDLNTRGDMRRYWFALRTLATFDQNGLFASMLAPLEPERVDLARLMEYPDLNDGLPATVPIPDNYEITYPEYGLTRIRRGRTSAGIMHTGQSRWVSLRRSGAVISAVRFASAFFGKGQFVPTKFERRDDGSFYFSQELEAGYYQPLDRAVDSDAWRTVRGERDRTEICRMTYEGDIRETESGFEITIRAHGTDGVPLAIEIALHEGGEITGVKPVEATANAFLLRTGFAEYRMGPDVIRFGPGRAEHAYIEVRGAEPKPDSPCVYLTGFTPFEHTLVFDMN